METIRDAIRWIGSHLWKWTSVLLVFSLLYAAGISAMYSNSYIAAAVLYFVSISILTAKSLSSEETSKHPASKIVSIFIILLAASLFAGSLAWDRSVHKVMRTQSKEQPSQQSANPFSVQLENIMDVENPPMFYIRNGSNLCAASIGLYMNLTNLQPRPSMIADFKVEAQDNTSGVWCRSHTCV